jgi:hypothetical protein
MGCFLDLPNDVIWLVLRLVIRAEVDRDTRWDWVSFSSRSRMATLLRTLSVSTRLQKLLKQKCRWTWHSFGTESPVQEISTFKFVNEVSINT